jgi:hypothetical protein
MHGEGAEMNEEVALENGGGTEPSPPTPLVMPTGYRVGFVPDAIEVSARLGTPQEVRQLIKVLRGSLLIFATDAEDAPQTLTHRVEAIRAASLKQ